jgi:hypothetical protein
MLGHAHRDRRQLGHLSPGRLDGIDALAFGEHVRADPTSLRPVLDDLINLLGRQERPVTALVPDLAATLESTPLPRRPRRRRRRILRRRQRRVPRTPIQTTLELGNPSLEPFVRLNQTLIRIYQLVEPQQQPDSRLAITIEDRLRIDPLHTKPFATRTRVPAPPERLLF